MKPMTSRVYRNRKQASPPFLSKYIIGKKTQKGVKPIMYVQQESLFSLEELM